MARYDSFSGTWVDDNGSIFNQSHGTPSSTPLPHGTEVKIHNSNGDLVSGRIEYGNAVPNKN